MRRIIDSCCLPIENWHDWVVVGSHNTHNGKTHGYVLSGGQFTTIDVPTGVLTNGTGINPEGEIVEKYRTADGRFHGFLLRQDFLA